MAFGGESFFFLVAHGARLDDSPEACANVKAMSDEDTDTRAGLCASCVHARSVESSKGSTFIRCELSFGDPRFPRYPTLPVLRCDGYQRSTQQRAGV